ncbi:hypothetical protein C8Q75DRAFT_100706 [Abortiporus biennis]|nr:hypothetical protein C8Q75DRAFT_100706 [Abortiporus biennis]
MCESTCSVLLVTIPLVSSTCFIDSPFSQDQMVDSMFTMWIYNHESRRQFSSGAVITMGISLPKIEN